MTDDRNAKAIVMGCFLLFAFSIGKYIGKQKKIQELCSIKNYDFCEVKKIEFKQKEISKND